MNGCDCSFAWHSVIPPTHCPKCGRCLGCGYAPVMPYPQPFPYPVPMPMPLPYPNYWPWSSQPSRIICTTNNTVMM